MTASDKLYDEMLKEKEKATLKYIGKTIEKQLADESDREEESGIKMPESLRTSLQQMIDDEKRNEEKCEKAVIRKKRLRTLGKVCAVIIAAVLIVGITMPEAVNAVKVRITRLFVNNTHNSVQFGGETDGGSGAGASDDIAYAGAISESWERYWYPEYLPEGYEIDDTDLFGVYKIMCFTDGNHKMDFYQAPSDHFSMNVDNEHGEQGEVRINNDVTGYWVTVDDSVILVWTQDDDMFSLDGKTELKELVKIADSIKFKSK